MAIYFHICDILHEYYPMYPTKVERMGGPTTNPQLSRFV